MDALMVDFLRSAREYALLKNPRRPFCPMDILLYFAFGVKYTMRRNMDVKLAFMLQQ
jgi:hypothetical protein